MPTQVGADALHQAILWGVAVFGSSGVVGGIVAVVKTKSDYKSALAKLEQDAQKNAQDSARADRKQDNENSKQRYDEAMGLYHEKSAECNKLKDEIAGLKKEIAEEKTVSETLRRMWADLYDTTLDDVMERENVRHKRLQKDREKTNP